MLEAPTSRSSALWKTLPTKPFAGKTTRMYFVPVMQRPLSDKGPIDEDMSLYVGALVIQTDRPMNDMESHRAQNPRRHQPEPHRRQISNL